MKLYLFAPTWLSWGHDIAYIDTNTVWEVPQIFSKKVLGSIGMDMGYKMIKIWDMLLDIRYGHSGNFFQFAKPWPWNHLIYHNKIALWFGTMTMFVGNRDFFRGWKRNFWTSTVEGWKIRRPCQNMGRFLWLLFFFGGHIMVDIFSNYWYIQIISRGENWRTNTNQT